VQDSAALRDAAAKARRQADAEALVHGHPRVQALLTKFPGAFVVPGSIRPA
jgi:DNA polymerase III subunit gamma/tau